MKGWHFLALSFWFLAIAVCIQLSRIAIALETLANR